MIDSFKGKYRFLSNFYPVGIFYKRIYYPSVEHAYQASKTTDRFRRRIVAALPNPGAAKRMGYKLPMRPGWNAMRVGVMRRLLRLKFEDKSLQKFLLDTGNEELVEGNDWGDTFWGVCKGKGENQLGKLLMEIRNELQ